MKVISQGEVVCDEGKKGLILVGNRIEVYLIGCLLRRLSTFFVTEEQIQNIIKTKKYPMTIGELYDHYCLALFFLLPPGFFVFSLIKDWQADHFLFVLSCLFFSLSMFIFFYQGPKQSKFEEIKIDNKDVKELYKISEEVFLLLKWKIVCSNQHNYIKAFRSWGFHWGADRGQEITVIVCDGSIQIISLYSRLTQATFWRPNRNDSNISLYKKNLALLIK